MVFGENLGSVKTSKTFKNQCANVSRKFPILFLARKDFFGSRCVVKFKEFIFKIVQRKML